MKFGFFSGRTGTIHCDILALCPLTFFPHFGNIIPHPCPQGFAGIGSLSVLRNILGFFLLPSVPITPWSHRVRYRYCLKRIKDATNIMVFVLTELVKSGTQSV